ncbi:MAG: hypothetical protein K8T90_16315 [Planctomycetes bacterium]|nr:hypothetical protein [Planctomycetota bacterium]
MTPFATDPSLLRRFATASWPLLRAFGVQVRVHWTTVLVPLVIFAGLGGGGSPGRTTEEAALLTAFFTVSTYVVIWSHEMGHVWAARGVGMGTTRITLHPLGGLFHLQECAPSPRAEIWVALAGPLTHAFWFVLAGAPYLLFFRGSGAEVAAASGDLRGFMVEGFLWTNVALLFLNLLPFWPTDMGRVLRASMALRMYPSHASLLAAYAGFAGGTVLAVAGLAITIQSDAASLLSSLGGPVLVVIGMSNFVACRSLLVESRWGDNPYAATAPRPQTTLPNATWNFEDPTPAEPVHVEDRREMRAAAAAAPRQQRRREPSQLPPVPLHERIDELLDRINEVGGIEHLPEAERKELAEASEKLRATPRT